MAIGARPRPWKVVEVSTRVAFLTPGENQVPNARDAIPSSNPSTASGNPGRHPMIRATKALESAVLSLDSAIDMAAAPMVRKPIAATPGPKEWSIPLPTVTTAEFAVYPSTAATTDSATTNQPMARIPVTIAVAARTKINTAMVQANQPK